MAWEGLWHEQVSLPDIRLLENPNEEGECALVMALHNLAVQEAPEVHFPGHSSTLEEVSWHLSCETQC